MARWKDKTSYSLEGKDRTPRNWELADCEMRVMVHRLRGSNGWFLSVYNPTLFDQWPLMNPDIEEAKKEALDMVERHLKDLLAVFTKAAK